MLNAGSAEFSNSCHFPTRRIIVGEDATSSSTCDDQINGGQAVLVSIGPTLDGVRRTDSWNAEILPRIRSGRLYGNLTAAEVHKFLSSGILLVNGPSVDRPAEPSAYVYPGLPCRSLPFTTRMLSPSGGLVSGSLAVGAAKY